MAIPNFTTKKNMTILMLCIGLVQIAGYYLAGMLASPDGSMAVPQPDTLLYCQAARRIVEGHPFSFSEGTAVSTGTTSVLYPFILAIPYALGATGDALFMAGFWLNAIFYLIFLFGWGQALWQWLEHPWARLMAILLLAISGHPTICAMAQSDIGFWMAVSALLAWGCSVNKPALYGSVLILAPWVRPEGMLCVIAFGIILVANTWFRRKDESGTRMNHLWAILILAVISLFGVFLLNYALTGHAQFSSVAYKGYFKIMPFVKAFYNTAGDFWKITKEILFSLAGGFPRTLYAVPLLGGLLFIIGIFCFPWRESKNPTGLLLLLLASGGGFITVAYSGWQNTNLDRYLAWITPLLVLFTAYGTISLVERLPKNTWKPLLPLIILTGSAFNSACLCSSFHLISTMVNRRHAFYSQEVEPALPPHASIGALDCGSAYSFSSRRVANIGGIYSPEFQVPPGEAYRVEILSNEPQTRFDYWLGDVEAFTRMFGDSSERFTGPLKLSGPDGHQIRTAQWDTFNRAQMPIRPPLGLSLVAKVDIGYEKEERSASYTILDRYGREPFPLFIETSKLQGKDTIDCGRVIIGQDEMTIPVIPQKDMTLILRTSLSRKLATPLEIVSRTEQFSFANPLSLNFQVDGHPVGTTKQSLSTNSFSEISFKIAGNYLTQSPAKITILGDHIAFCYWFYQ